MTYVGLYVDGSLYDSWETNDLVVERYVPEIPADCGETVDVELVSMNLVSVEPVTVDATSFTTPSPEPPVAEDVLSVGFEAYGECAFGDLEACLGCTVTIILWAQDISDGDAYPVTNVALWLDGGPGPEYDSGSVSTGYFEHTYPYEEAWCGDTIEIEVRATNSIGQAIAIDSFTTPSHP